MAPKIAGVVVAFFQNLHYVHSHFRASLVFESSHCVKILSKFFDFCQVNHEHFSIVGNCKLCLPLLVVGVLAPEVFPYPGRIQCYFFCIPSQCSYWFNCLVLGVGIHAHGTLLLGSWLNLSVNLIVFFFLVLVSFLFMKFFIFLVLVNFCVWSSSFSWCWCSCSWTVFSWLIGKLSHLVAYMIVFLFLLAMCSYSWSFSFSWFFAPTHEVFPFSSILVVDLIVFLFWVLVFLLIKFFLVQSFLLIWTSSFF